jgi:hypothetical protein
MTDRKRIRLVGGSEAELVGDGAATTDAETALDAALAALARRASTGSAPPATVRAASICGQAAIVWTPVIDAAAYHVLRPATAGVARYPADAKYRTTDVFCLDSEVTPGATYFYAVATESAVRDVSVPSAVVSVSITAEAPPPIELDWKPTIGAPAWGNLDVAEVSLLSRFDARASQLRPFVIASLDDSLSYRSRLTEAVEHLRQQGRDRPFVGVSIRSDTLSQPALVSELGGIANDLGRFGVGLAIRVDR